ncbi:MAG: hypothetical protein ACOCYU_04870 [Brevefilum sp.]
MTPFLTLFTAPKPFTDPHIALIQRNTLRNWKALDDTVEVVVIGDEPGIADVCAEMGLIHLPDVDCNAMGTPLISSIFDLARSVNKSPYLAYANADILFLPELLGAVRAVGSERDRFLGVGQRWDLDVEDPISFADDWGERLRQRAQRDGELHGQTGSDYFIYPRSCFREIPDFAVGRAGWDNWMIFRGRWQHWPVVDMTDSLMAIHQNHGYAHLPGGVIHYKQPETHDNVRMAGGRRTIFKLSDATHELSGDRLNNKPLNWSTFWREVEIFPLTWLHSRFLGYLSFSIFHPIKAIKEFRGWLAYKLNQR